jgi:putative transposase
VLQAGVLAGQNDEWAGGHRYMGLEILAACRKAGQPAKDNESPETAVAIDAIVA